MSVLASIESMDFMMNVSKIYYFLKDYNRLILCFGNTFSSDSCIARVSIFCEPALKLSKNTFQAKVNVTLKHCYFFFCCP